MNIFSTHHSISKSILTANKPKKEFDVDSSVSIFDIAQKHNLKTVRVIESSLSGFLECYLNADIDDTQLIFGYNISVVNSLGEKDNSESVVTVWIRNSDGYQDLLKINKFIQNEGYVKDDLKGYITWEELNNLFTNNLLVTIPFYSGFLYKNLMSYGSSCVPKFDKFRPIFFVEKHGLPFDEYLLEKTKSFCENNNFELSNSHSIYYYNNAHAESLMVLRCIQKRSTFEKPELPDFSSDKFSFESYLDFYGEKFDNNFDDLFTKYVIPVLDNGARLPEVKISNEDRKFYNFKGGVDNYEFLSALVTSGLKQKILNNPSLKNQYDVYFDRCKEELDIFKKLYVVDYILLVRDIVNWASNNNIKTGWGRGSVCGSLVCFLIGITKIDPIPYKLYFSRFLSEARAKSKNINGIIYLDPELCPDIDLDFEFSKRNLVIKYLYEKYKGKISQISTFSTLTGKILIKEVTKIILNYSEADAKHVSDTIDKVFGVVQDLDKAYIESRAFKNWVDSNPNHLKCYKIARNLENLIKNQGCHPSGYAISYDDINSIVPLVRTPDGDTLASAFDMKNVSKCLIKVDLLGLRSLSVIDGVEKITKFNIENIDLNDKTIYEYLKERDSYHGLFQIEARTNKAICKEVVPENVDDLSAILAISRPGALQFSKKYAEFRKTGVYEKYDEHLDKILSETGGACLFQETMLRIAHETFQFTLEEAELIRRACGKKLPEEMKKYEEIIYQKGKELDLPEETCSKFYKILIDSASYSFNKSHSVAYSALTAITTYLKANYPKEFFLSLLRMAKYEPNPIEEIGIIQKELYNFGIELLPPNIKKSEEDFEIEGGNIRYGLSAIKGISDAAITKLASFEREYSTKFELFNNCFEAKLGLGVVRSLIQAGCFPDYNLSRAKLTLEFEIYNILTTNERILVNKMSKMLGDDLFKIIKYLKENKDSNGKLYLKESRVDTIRNKYKNYEAIYKVNKSYGKLLYWLMENKCLGYSYSGNLVSIYRKEYPEIRSIYEAISSENNSYITLIGLVRGVKEGKSRVNKNPYIRFELHDDYNMINAMAFRENINVFKDGKDKLIDNDTLAVVRIKKIDDNTGFVDKATVLWDTKLITRTNQIKDKEFET